MDDPIIHADPITGDWLVSVGFRPYPVNWWLWFGGGPSMVNRHSDMAIELRGLVHGEFSAWLVSQRAALRDTMAIRTVKHINEVIDLVRAISGRPWNPANHANGTIKR